MENFIEILFFRKNKNKIKQDGGGRGKLGFPTNKL